MRLLEFSSPFKFGHFKENQDSEYCDCLSKFIDLGMKFIAKSIEIPKRIKVPYVVQGDPSGVPMLLLHGFTDSWHSFERVLSHLPQTVQAFAQTQRGHGDADRAHPHPVG
jgi:hypothetical protein